jgi:hypothetical protein
MTHDPKRVVIAGCGGIGSWLAQAMARSLEFQAPGSMMVLVDGDSFETKNVERQVFDALGNKAVSLRNTIQPMVPSTFVVARPAWIVSEESNRENEEGDVTKVTPQSLLEENDVVFAVVDNFATRAIILDAAKEFDNIDIFLGGNDDQLYGTVVHYQRRDGQDVTYHPGVFHEEFVNPPDKNPGELSCAERAKLDGGTQLLAVNLGVTANLMAKAAYVMFGTEDQFKLAISNSEVCFDLAYGVSQPYDRLTDYGKSIMQEKKQLATT